ncbi:MAG TPA: diacylglycerol kinase family protein [Verrucomicrobiae bacterium]|nr:diacylglycerol kinase family protein [Verrucomicrobiae bacterium]
MYYYIFEPPQGPKEYERTAQIKDFLSQLGIAGEMAAPQPGRTAEDLVNVAVSKRYSTVVTVGGMDLINRVARALLPYDAVLGIIPLNDDPDIANLVGTSDWKTAAEQLKRRRWQHTQLGMMNGSICFLTPASITVPSGSEFHVSANTFEFSSKGPASIRIAPLRHNESPEAGLVLDISQQQKAKTSLFKMFSSKEPAPQESHFVVSTLSLTTTQSCPVVVAGETLTGTPVSCATESKGIRLIIGKGSAG